MYNITLILFSIVILILYFPVLIRFCKSLWLTLGFYFDYIDKGQDND